MLTIKKNKNLYDYDVISIIEDDHVLEISYQNNLDLYWTFYKEKGNESNLDIQEFMITKADYDLYMIFDNLYEAIKTKKPYLNFPYDILERHEKVKDYNNLFNGKEIKWYSDDFADIEKASSITIRKYNDYIKIIMTKSKIEECNSFYFPTTTVRIRTSGSRYTPFYIPFMSQYQMLKKYDPSYHQIHIEEYLYLENQKRRVRKK